MSEINGGSVRVKSRRTAWTYLLLALLGFVLGSILVNMAAGRLSNGAPIQRAFNVGALETVTPVSLAPWWLVGRAQLDCQQFMPLASTQTSIVAAIARPKFVLGDRKVKPCSLLASYAERKRLSGNMRETSRNDGFFTAGSLTLPAIAVLGVPLTRWINVLLLVGAGGLGLWMMCTGKAQDVHRDRIAATACMMIASALVLAVPGSLTAIPTMAILLLSIFGVLRLLKQGRDGRDIILKLAPLVAAAMLSLDPTGGSVPVGFGCILLLARLVSTPGDKGATVLDAAGFYMLTVILCWLAFALCIGIAKGSPDAGEVLFNQLTALSEVGSLTALQAGTVGTYQWLSNDALLGPLGALDLMLTVLFGIATYSVVRPVSPAASLAEPLWTALIAIAPVVLWALLYPGYWSGNEDQYSLLAMWVVAIALSGPLCLLVEGARRLARKRKALPAPSAPASEASPFA